MLLGSGHDHFHYKSMMVLLFLYCGIAVLIMISEIFILLNIGYLIVNSMGDRDGCMGLGKFGNFGNFRELYRFFSLG